MRHRRRPWKVGQVPHRPAWPTFAAIAGLGASVPLLAGGQAALVLAGLCIPASAALLAWPRVVGTPWWGEMGLAAWLLAGIAGVALMGAAGTLDARGQGGAALAGFGLALLAVVELPQAWRMATLGASLRMGRGDLAMRLVGGWRPRNARQAHLRDGLWAVSLAAAGHKDHARRAAQMLRRRGSDERDARLARVVEAAVEARCGAVLRARRLAAPLARPTSAARAWVRSDAALARLLFSPGPGTRG